jgi:hypothetical protein
MLPLGGLHVKLALERGIMVQTQHLLWDQGKQRKTLIEFAGRMTFRMQLTSSGQCGIKYASPNISPSLCSFFYFNFKLFLQTFLSVYNLDKHQTVYNTYGRNERIFAQIYISVSVIL